MAFNKQLGYDARQISSQNTQKTLQKASIFGFEAVKWVVNFIGDMIKILLAK
jgi:hypothetical protein